MDPIVTALLPAIGQLASWLVSLLIKKVGPKAGLVQAKVAIHQAIQEHKVAMALKKRRDYRGFTTVSAAVTMILAMVAVVAIFIYSAYAKADPITNTAGKSSTTVAVIAQGATTSSAIDLGAFTLVGINMPASFTGTALTFLMSNSLSGPWQPVYNQAGQVSYSVVGGRYYAMSNITDFQGVRYLEIVSGSAEAAARNITLSIKTQY